MNYRNTLWTGLLACAALIGMATASFAVTQADIARLKGQIESRQEFSEADFDLAREINETTHSFIDLKQAQRINDGLPLQERQPRQPGGHLDEYEWTEVTYEWIDITGVGTVVVNADDVNEGPFDLGFTVTYFDADYTSLRICSNGFVSFTSTSNSLGNGAIPNAVEPNTAIYGFWDDLNPGAGGDVYRYADAANNRYIISWVNVLHFAGTEVYSFQIVINAGGSIQVNYNTITETGTYGNFSSTGGIEDAAGTVGLQVFDNGAGTLPTSEWSIEYSEGEQIFANVSGTITLDGGAGIVTAANVVANGSGAPSTNPAANGTYTLTNVQIGDRRISANLTGYHPASQNIVLTNAGMTGVNLTLVRTDPPVPTNLVGAADNNTGVVTLDWDNSTDALVDVYPVYRRMQGEQTWVLQGSPATSTFQQTLTENGIFQYAVSARDNGVSTPVESELTGAINVLYGELPVTSIGGNGNYDDRIRLNWLEPGISEGTEIVYDDGSSEVWFRVTSPNTENNYFCQRMTPPDDASYPLMLYAASVYMERSDPLPWVALCPPNETNTGADLDNPLYVWTEIGADSTPGWLYAETDGSVFLQEAGDFYIVIQFPVGVTGPGCGSDNSASDGRAYWTWPATLPNWNFFGSYDWMMRAWVGGPPPEGLAGNNGRIELVEIDGRGGYAEDRVPSKSIITPTFGDDKSSMLARAEYQSHQGFQNPLDQWFAPYSRAPEVELRFNGRGALDELVNYRVYRDGSMVGEPTETSYFDLGRTENVDYDYYVTAYYDNGQESGPSPVITRSCNMPPAAPSALDATPQGQTQMTLVWSAPTTNDDATPLVDLAGFHVYRDGVEIGTTAAGVTTFLDTPPDNQTFYTWTVKAHDEVPNLSDPSNAAVAAIISPWEVVDFEWVDITGTGTVIVNSDDVNSGLMDLPFEFEFYEQVYTQFSVCSNGWLSFTSISNSLNGTIPNTFEPNATIAGCWMDLNPGAGGDVYMLDDAANGRLIISWVGVPQFGNPANVYTFQIILEPPTGIHFYYQSVPVNIGTVGVENETGTDAIALWQQGAGIFHPTNETGVAFWADPPVFAPLSGTITLDGGSGSVAQTLVRGNGSGNPTTNPNAQGQYTLAAVATGNRTVTASLAGYNTTIMPVIHDEDGTTGVNITLVRSDPPVPVNFTGSVNSTSGLVSLNWDNSVDPLVDVYPVYRKLSTEQNWILVGSPTASAYTETLTIDGIYQYQVAARDNGVSTPVESDPTAPITLLFGELPVTSLGANGNYDDRIVLNWLEPGISEGTLISYDDSTSEVWFRVSTPNTETDYFCMRMSPPDDASYPLMLYAATVYMEREDPLPWVALCPPNATNSGADLDNPLYEWTEIGADASPGWLFAETDGSVFLEEEGDFYIVIQFPPGLTGPGCGSDNSAPDSRAYWTWGQTLPAWNEFFSYDWMMRAWVGGPPPEGLAGGRGGSTIELYSNGEPTGYAMDRIPQSTMIKPVLNVSSKSSKASTPARIESKTSDGFYNPLDQWFAPYSRAPEVRCSIGREQGRSLDDITNYRVYRQGTGQIAQVDDLIHTYTDLNRVENTPYTYWVTALYDNGQESAESPHVTETCNMAPAAPTNLGSEPLGNTQMQLAWSAPTTNNDGTPIVDLAGFRIFRDGTQIGTTASGVTTYTDTPPDNQTFYTWSVVAVDEVPNVSDPSNSEIAAVVSPWETVDFDWVDITGVGTLAGITGDDQNVGPFDLGFTYTFYGVDYTSVHMCSNGWASFTSLSANYVNGSIPDNFEPHTALYCWWDDLYPPLGGSFYYYQDAANDRFIMSWIDVPHISNQAALYTFQIIIEANGGIYFNYSAVPTDNPGVTSGTIGVENETSTEAIELLANGVGAFTPGNQTAVAFWGGPSGAITGLVRGFSPVVPIAGAEVTALEAPGELGISDAQGNYTLEVEPGTYTVTVHKQGYCDQVFTGVVVDDGGSTTRNASLRQPNATIDVSSINIFALTGQNASGSFEITNPGGQCPVSYSISSNQNWLTVSTATGEVVENTTTVITVNGATANFAPGDYNGILTISHNDVDSPVDIPVTITMALTADENTEVPTVFALHANYPNPFNATTALNFDVPNESRVQITIFNVAGQEVARPVNEVMQAGSHTVLYTANNLPTGMYLVKMTAGSFSAVQKMVLLK